MKKKWIAWIGITAMAASLFAGCGAKNASDLDPDTAAAASGSSAGSGDAEETTQSSAADDDEETSQTAVPAGIVTFYDSLNASDMFKKREMSGSYDESAAEISLKEDEIETEASGVEVDGTTATITQEGTYILSGSLDDGQIIVEVSDQEKVQLVLDDVTMKNDDSACILVREADKVYITLADGSNNSLSDTGEDYKQESSDYKVNGVILSRSDLALNGSGTLEVNAGYKNGIATKDDLVISGGTYVITAASRGLLGKDSVRIKDGNFTINSEDNGIYSSRADKAGKGFIYIEDGSFQITSGNDAIHAATELWIAGGTIDITECKEGLEAATIDQDGGEVKIKASDDGINAALTDSVRSENEDLQDVDDKVDPDSYYRIRGGSLAVSSEGDGIDSNGMVYVDGGDVVIEGPEDEKYGPLDFGSGAQISAGTFIATGSEKEAVTFEESSAQRSIHVTFDSEVDEGTTVKLCDEDGDTIMETTPEKSFRTVLFSSPEISDGEYTVKAGDESVEVTVSGISTVA